MLPNFVHNSEQEGNSNIDCIPCAVKPKSAHTWGGEGYTHARGKNTKWTSILSWIVCRI